MAIPTPYIRILVHLVYTVARYTSFRHLFKMHSVGIACNMRTACIMKMQATAASGHGDLIPQYSDLRRLPMCYQHILPLEVMKRYHHFLSLFQIHTIALVLTDQMKEKN